MKRLNLRLFVGLLVALIFVGGGVHLIHAWQVTRNADALHQLARDARQDGRDAEAIEYLERYLDLVPDDVTASVEYAELLHAKATTLRAWTRVFLLQDEILRRDPQRYDVRRRQIELALQIGRFADGLVHVAALRQAGQADGEISAQAGRCYEALGQTAEAMTEYRAAIEQSPHNLAAYERLAILLRQRDQPEAADTLLAGMLAANSQSADAHATRARFRRTAQSLEAASEDARTAVELDPDSAAARLIAGQLALLRADAAQVAGHREEAARDRAESIEHLRHGVTHHADHVGLRTALAGAYAEAGQLAEAVAVLQPGIERRPNDLRLLTLLIELRILQGQPEKARELLQHIPAQETELLGLRKSLNGRILAAGGEWTRAVDELETARAESVNRPELLLQINRQLALCYTRLGQPRLEADAWRRVLDSDPGSVAARLGLARLFRQTQRTDDALREYRQLSHVASVQPVLVRILIARNMRLPDIAREWQDVEQLLERIENRDHDPIELALLRAELLAVRSRRNDARKVLESVRDMHPERTEPRQALAQLAELGPHDAAALGLSLLVGSDGDAVDIAQFAEALLRHDDPERAAVWIERLAALQPHSFVVVQLRARLLAKHGDEAGIVTLLEQYADDDKALPADAAVRLGLAAALADQLAQQQHAAGKKDSELARLAESMYRRYIERHPTQVLLLVGFLARQGRIDDAWELSDRAWETSRSELAAEASMIVLYSGELPAYDLQRLEEKLTSAVRRDPQSVPLHISLADFRSLQGDYAAAEILYQEVLAIKPDNLLALNNLAWLLALQGRNLPVALAHVERAIGLYGPTPQLLDTRACVSMALGRGQDAIHDLQTVLARQPQAMTYLRLAAAWEMAGSDADARDALKQARAAGLNPQQLHPLERQHYRTLLQRLHAS